MHGDLHIIGSDIANARALLRREPHRRLRDCVRIVVLPIDLTQAVRLKRAKRYSDAKDWVSLDGISWRCNPFSGLGGGCP